MASIQSVIAMVDRHKENAFDEELKMAWLTELNGFVALNIHLLDIAEVRQLPHVYPDDLEAELLVGYPHDGIYRLWLEAKIDYQNGEYDKYQNSMLAYNAALDDYERWFAETYNPGGTWPMGTGCHVPTHYITAYGLAVMQGYRGTLAQWLVSLRGGHYVPAVSQPEAGMLQVAFTPSGEDLPAVESATVVLPQGEQGVTPHIGENNHWWIGDTDTGIQATGPSGKDGKDAIGLPEIEIEELHHLDVVLPYNEEKHCAGTVLYRFPFIPIVGHTYRVEWDGTNYDCTAQPMLYGNGGAYLGNAGFVTAGAWDADIPFAIIVSAQRTMEICGNSQEELDITIIVSELPDAGKLLGVAGGAYGLVAPPAGIDGKSAYEYAVEGGYTGTEQEFAEKLAKEYLSLKGGTVQGDINLLNGILRLVDTHDGGVYLSAFMERQEDPQSWYLQILENSSDYPVRLRGIGTPQDVNEAANKGYVDTAITDALAKIGIAEEGAY